MENDAAISDIVEYKFATPQRRRGKTPPKHHWFQSMQGDKTEVEFIMQGGEDKKQALSEEELRRVRRERRDKSSINNAIDRDGKQQIFNFCTPRRGTGSERPGDHNSVQGSGRRCRDIEGEGMVGEGEKMIADL
eukprot:755659-Hanusia_phi.AAC.1